MKEQIDKLNLIKMKHVCFLKDTNQRIKGQTTKREKMLAKNITDERFVSKLHKEL